MTEQARNSLSSLQQMEENQLEAKQQIPHRSCSSCNNSMANHGKSSSCSCVPTNPVPARAANAPQKRVLKPIFTPCRLYPCPQKPRLVCPVPNETGAVPSNGNSMEMPLWSGREQGLSAVQRWQCQGNCKGSFSPQISHWNEGTSSRFAYLITWIFSFNRKFL